MCKLTATTTFLGFNGGLRRLHLQQGVFAGQSQKMESTGVEERGVMSNLHDIQRLDICLLCFVCSNLWVLLGFSYIGKHIRLTVY